MKWTKKVQPFIKGIQTSLERFPFTIALLVAFASLNAWSIQTDATRFDRWMVSLLIGVFLSAFFELVYERFFDNTLIRIGLQAISLGSVGIYYVLTRSYSLEYLPLAIRTGVFFGTIVLAFFWVPSIKNNVYFHETLLAGLKAFFLANLFSLVTLVGTSALLFAVDRLLVSIPDRLYSHVLNINFSLLAPLFFLSFIPWYPGMGEPDKDMRLREKDTKKMEMAIAAPRSLEVLLSYIIIPLLVVYTFVLILYFATNIGQNFWSDPIVESLLLSYSITGVLIYLLACTIETKIAVLFRKIFPKLLIVVMAFQLYASFRRMQSIGLTHGRYFVLLTGLATLLIGLVVSFTDSKKTGWVAVIALVASLIAIIPPVDGFTVGRQYQLTKLYDTLERNNMLTDTTILKNESVSPEDKATISRSISYLEEIDSLKKVTGINQAVLSGNEFSTLFGFDRTVNSSDDPFTEETYVNLYLMGPLELNVEDFHYLLQIYDQGSTEGENSVFLPNGSVSFEVEGKTYRLEEELTETKDKMIILKDQTDKVLQTVSLTEQYQTVINRVDSVNSELSLEEATIDNETEESLIRIIFTSVSLYEEMYMGDFYLVIQIK